MQKHILTLVIALLFSLTIQAYKDVNFHVLDVKSGISDNYIQDILHDQYGFMWFATCNGLSRYDGYHFKQYTTTQLSANSNNVEWVSEDAAGMIWIKTPVDYCVYNREKDELDNNIQAHLNKMGITGTPKKMFVDENKNLWCIVGNTLFHYQFEQERLFSFVLPDAISLLYLTCRETSAYLLLSDGCIASINWKEKKIQKETSIELNAGFHPHIYLDTFFNIWFYVTHGSQVKCYSTTEKEWIAFPGQEVLKNDHNNITTVADDGKGNIWIGTDNNGVFICHYYKKQFTKICKEASKMYSLPSNHITRIFKDDKDMMWIGTGKQGVAYTSLNTIYFENIRCPQQEDVSCLLEDHEENLWFGFDGEGIARYDKKQQKYIYYKSENNEIPSNLIVCSFLDSQKRIWWGSFGGGTFYYEGGKFVSLCDVYKKDITHLPQYVRRITEDDNGNIWFATYAQGLVCMDSRGNFSSYNVDNSIIQTNYIADISCADGRMIYIATSSGVYSMDTYTQQINHLIQDKNGNKIIHDEYANCIYQDSRGLLWIGGRKGVNVYNIKENALIHLDTSKGLSHSYIRAIVEDDNRNVWITTDHGITHVSILNDPEQKRLRYHCRPYFEEDGLANFTFNNFSIICNKEKDILIGGSGGYVKIRSTLSSYNHYEHPVIFTGLYLVNKRMDVGSPTPDGRIILTKNIQLLKAITMDYSDSNFALEVSAVDYGNLHKIQYVYRLGEKEEWIGLEGNRINFNRLSPGTHRLQVKVNENQESKNNQPTILIIHVRPPFWLSIPAYMTYVACIVLCVVLILKQMRRKHIRILQQQKREMVISQQHEMNEAKMRFFTNVSHDLRTPLSLIISPLEKIIDSDTSLELKDDLDMMHRNALTLLDEVNQLLDFRKLDQQKTQLSPSYGNLSDFIKETCTSFHSLFLKNGLKLQLRINTPDLEMNFDKNKMQRIMLNLITNAIKYNNEHGDITVTLDKILDANGEQARIQVADTGIGIKEANKDKIFDRFFQEQHATTMYAGSGIGLHIVKEYVVLHGGIIEVKNNQPKGSIFIITLPITGAVEVYAENVNSSSQERLEEVEAEVAPETSEDKVAVLVVEDNHDFRNFLINSLKGHYQVFDAQDGKKALAVLAQHSVHIVITDVMMPVMDGMELCHKIKTDIRYSHIPVVLLTARTADEHILSGLREGADDYITKPFNLNILLLRIQKLLQWTRHNHEKFKTIDISPAEITISSLDEKLIEKAICTVEENMDNSEFSVEDLSAAVNMSRGHLYKKLILITGKSPLEFIRVLRIKRGRQLIEQSQLSISEISYQVGLSPKQFSKYFKEEFGCLPSEYDKEVCK